MRRARRWSPTIGPAAATDPSSEAVHFSAAVRTAAQLMAEATARPGDDDAATAAHSVAAPDASTAA